jgi:hypothetical protein
MEKVNRQKPGLLRRPRFSVDRIESPAILLNSVHIDERKTLKGRSTEMIIGLTFAAAAAAFMALAAVGGG